MQTVILSPFSSNTEGIVESFANGKGMVVKYIVKSKTNKVMRLWAMSSRKPSNEPLRIDVPVFEKEKATGIREISEIDLSLKGYMPEDIDTFALSWIENDKAIIASAGFGRLKWDISYSINRICPVKYNPMAKAELLLSKIKREPVDKKLYLRLMMDFKESINKLERSEYVPHREYKWYKCTLGAYPFDLSIFTHICKGVNSTQEGGLLLGVRSGGHMALAIRSDKDNPFSNADDCTIYTNGFWIVGLWFSEEGQRFERIKKGNTY